MLKKVKVSRFKSVKLFERDFGGLTLLVGSNNSGKSTVLQAIHFAVAIAQSRRRLADQENVDASGTSFSIAAQQIIYTPQNDVLALGFGGGLTQTEGKHIHIEFEFDNGHRGEIKLRKGRNRNLSVVVRGEHVIARIEDLNNPFSVYVPGLAGIAKHESFIARGQLLRAVARSDANLVLRNVLYALKGQPQKWGDFCAAFNEVFPGLNLRVAFASESDEFIEVNIEKGGSVLPLDAAGTGVLQTIQILSYVYLFRPVVTLLDEPDSHLHPNNQRALAQMLAKFAQEGRTQIVLATHSRHVLDALRDTGERVWMRKGEAQSRTDYLDFLVDLGALDNAEGLLSRGIQYVFLTEDEKKKYLKVLLHAYGIAPDRYQIWSYKGSSKLEAAEALGGFIREVSASTKVIVHRDSDYLLQDDFDRLRQQYSRANLNLFFTPGVDIESLFCRKDHLKSINPGDELLVEGAITAAELEVESEMREKAEKGAKQVDVYRFRHNLSTRGDQERETWLSGINILSERWRHGKILLAAIRRQFQQQNLRTLKVETSSTHLKFADLDQILQTSTTTTSLVPQISGNATTVALPQP